MRLVQATFNSFADSSHMTCQTGLGQDGCTFNSFADSSLVRVVEVKGG